MASGFVFFFVIAAAIAGALLIAGGITLLAIGLRRHDDSTSRPFLAFGVGLLLLGTIVLIPTLFTAAQWLVG